VCVCVCDLYICGLFRRRWHVYIHAYIHTHSYILTYIHKYTHNTYIRTHTHTHTHVALLKCAPNVVFFPVWPLQSASESSCPILILEFSSVFAALCSHIHYFYMHVLLHQQPIDWLFAGVHTMYVTHKVNMYSFVVLHFLMKNYNISVCLFFSITN